MIKYVNPALADQTAVPEGDRDKQIEELFGPDALDVWVGLLKQFKECVEALLQTICQQKPEAAQVGCATQRALTKGDWKQAVPSPALSAQATPTRNAHTKNLHMLFSELALASPLFDLET